MPSPDSFPWGASALVTTFEAARELLNTGMPFFKVTARGGAGAGGRRHGGYARGAFTIRLPFVCQKKMRHERGRYQRSQGGALGGGA